MLKIDKLIIKSFVGPFILTFLVVVFILLLQHMLKYFDDIIGKDLGWDVVGTLLFYFAVFMTPLALPLAILLSSLITFGNLSEHFEITAIKSLGISLTRALVPIFLMVIGLTFFAFYVNNTWVPHSALEAYSLLYDIKQKKPALDLQEGAFYSGIPDISIKVNRKFPDGKSLKGVMIYDHRSRIGNKQVTSADSGRMYTILNDQYLKLELYNGYDYTEGADGQRVGPEAGNQESLRKTHFAKSEIVFDLSSFGLARTDKRWFQGNRIMRSVFQLEDDMDSLKTEINQTDLSRYKLQFSMFNYHRKGDTLQVPPELKSFQQYRDSVDKARDPYQTPFALEFKPVSPAEIDTTTRKASDSLFKAKPSAEELTLALNYTRTLKAQLLNLNTNRTNYVTERKVFQIQWHKILSNSIACIVMFLIGAPLGAIIKKGGLGFPVIFSIFFFILFYLFMSTGEKWALQDRISVPQGIWAADCILAVIGLFFLRQARLDARLFDSDYYRVIAEKLKRRFGRRPEGVSAR
ncbi:MAG: LptF/LptG family permease [Cyclobacteriaceae bacterium]|nr:LptF/LptG family permease [Cyclobacteriaceae bacterium]